MKKMLWLLLAAIPMQAVASEEDPIAYKCYYCTPDEMEDVALAQGTGRHYVYDASKMTIFGYDVTASDGLLEAHRFEAPDWVRSQFFGMMSLYNPTTGEMHAETPNVRLLAPDTEHGRSSRYLWGQHLTALNPLHSTARRYIVRYLSEHDDLRFLDTAISGGPLLRFKYMVDDFHPILATVSFDSRNDSIATYYFDHDNRSWRYLSAYLPQDNSRKTVQESRDDFVSATGEATFAYRSGEHRWVDAFVERATWANIPVHGQLPSSGAVRFTCRRGGMEIQCYVD